MCLKKATNVICYTSGETRKLLKPCDTLQTVSYFKKRMLLLSGMGC